MFTSNPPLRPPGPPPIDPIDLHPPSDSTLRPRLGLPPTVRLLLTSTTAFTTGAVLGMVQGGRMAQLRFRAEHAHKMPTSITGWYLYHKSKNYHAAQGALWEGGKMGSQLAFWSSAVFALEHMVDGYRGKRDAVSTVVAGLTVAGIFSLWNRFNVPTTARTARYGLVFGLVFGGLQDAVTVLQGNANQLSYVVLFHSLSRRIRKWNGDSQSL